MEDKEGKPVSQEGMGTGSIAGPHLIEDELRFISSG